MTDRVPDYSAVIREMQAYYNARAPEYDEWFYCLGRYQRDRSPGTAEKWRAEAAALQATLRQLAPRGQVLELAAGTGLWTGILADSADRVHAVDGSAEALAVNRSKYGNRGNIVYEQANLFEWQPVRQYDAVVVCFWLSHVPPALLDDHLAMIRRALRPAGGLFLADSLLTPNSSASDHPPQDQPDHVVTRKLNDGSEHRIVKVFYSRADLEHAFARAAMPIRVRATGEFFLYAAEKSVACG